MRRKIRINPKTGVLYMPKEVLDDGFKGDVDVLANAITFTIVHPEADLEKVKESLEIVMRDLELRLKRGEPSAEPSGDRRPFNRESHAGNDVDHG